MDLSENVVRVGTNEFRTQPYHPEPPFLDEDVYSQLLDAVPIMCVDALVLNKYGHMMLAKRQQEPMAGFWVIGGRMRAGEFFTDTAVRNMRRELGLSLTFDRFEMLGLYNFMWPTRAQKPQKRGCHNVSLTFVLALEDSEIAQIRLNSEYAGDPLWIMPEAVLAQNRREEFHPAVRQWAQDLIRFLKNGRKPSFC